MHEWRDIAIRHGPLVWATAYRILQDHDEAADCHQEVFVDAIRRATSEAIENWPAFLRWLTVRRALDRLRRLQRVPAETSEVTNVAVEISPDREAEWIELLEFVRNELTRLPEQQAEVFWLHCVEEHSLTDVAQQLGLSAGNARVLLHRARAKLREALDTRHAYFLEGRS